MQEVLLRITRRFLFIIYTAADESNYSKIIKSKHLHFKFRPLAFFQKYRSTAKFLGGAFAN